MPLASARRESPAAPLSAPAAALFGAAAAGAWSRWKERLTRFPSVFYSSPTSAYELSHGVFRRLRRKRLLRKTLRRKSSNEFEDHEMEAHLSRMVSEFRVLMDERTVHFTEASSQSD